MSGGQEVSIEYLDYKGCMCRKCVRANNVRLNGFPLESGIMLGCKKCGNKRCPHGDDHEFVCTRSNALDQVPVRQQQVGGDHYASKAVQPWDAMACWMTREQFIGFLRGNAIKYLARCDDKGGIEDLRKAKHYLTKLIEFTEQA